MRKIWISAKENDGEFVKPGELDDLAESNEIYPVKFTTPGGREIVKWHFRLK